MSCLDSNGQPNSTKFKFLKGLLMTLFGISGTQLFSLLFHFFRLISYTILNTQSFPPKPLPKQTSLFGTEAFEHNLNFNDNSSIVYTIQVIMAAVGAVATGATGLTAMCREKKGLMRAYSIVMLIITFITGMGSYSSPNLVNIRNLILPLLGGGISSLSSFVFSMFTKKRAQTDRPTNYQNYYSPYNSNSYNSHSYNY